MFFLIWCFFEKKWILRLGNKGYKKLKYRAYIIRERKRGQIFAHNRLIGKSEEFPNVLNLKVSYPSGNAVFDEKLCAKRGIKSFVLLGKFKNS